MPPSICKFWQQGYCRNGASCKFQHSDPRGITSNNRFSALQSPNNTPDRNGFQNRSPSARSRSYHVDRDTIRIDLSTEKPQWILSAYGPTREAPAQLFGGPRREQSFEEMRLRHYEAMASGNPQQAVQEAQKLYSDSEQQLQTALSDLDGAVKFILDGENIHPNRFDICKGTHPDPTLKATGLSAFGQSSGGISAFAANNPFSTNQPTASTFGAPSVPATTSAFGQSSTLGQKSNPFGASVGSTGAFGQTSALGQKPNPFGAPPPTGGFGQPSALSQEPNPFGALSSTGTFGQTSDLGQQSNAFDNPPSGQTFGSANNNSNAPFSSFASLSQQSGQQTQPTSVFSGASQQTDQSNPLGQPFSQASNPFNSASHNIQPNPFRVPPGSSSAPALAAPSTTHQRPVLGGDAASKSIAGPQAQGVNPFGIALANQKQFVANPNLLNPFSSQQSRSIPFGKVDGMIETANINGASPFAPAQTLNGQARGGPHPPLESYTSQDGSGNLVMFKGMPVQNFESGPACQRRDGRWEKIWFPKGVPAPDDSTEVGDEAFDSTTKQAYEHFRHTGSFREGVMPLLPPKREWCMWDF